MLCACLFLYLLVFLSRSLSAHVYPYSINIFPPSLLPLSFSVSFLAGYTINFVSVIHICMCKISLNKPNAHAWKHRTNSRLSLQEKTCWPTAQDMNAGAGQSGATPPLRPRVSELQVAEAPLNPPCPRVPQAEALLEPPVPKASPVPEMPQPTPVPEPTPPLPPPSQMVKPEESIPLRFVAEPVGEGGANHGVGLSTQATQETLRLEDTLPTEPAPALPPPQSNGAEPAEVAPTQLDPETQVPPTSEPEQAKANPLAGSAADRVGALLRARGAARKTSGETLHQALLSMKPGEQSQEELIASLLSLHQSMHEHGKQAEPENEKAQSAPAPPPQPEPKSRPEPPQIAQTSVEAQLAALRLAFDNCTFST